MVRTKRAPSRNTWRRRGENSTKQHLSTRRPSLQNVESPVVWAHELSPFHRAHSSGGLIKGRHVYSLPSVRCPRSLQSAVLVASHPLLPPTHTPLTPPSLPYRTVEQVESLLQSEDAEQAQQANELNAGVVTEVGVT